MQWKPILYVSKTYVNSVPQLDMMSPAYVVHLSTGRRRRSVREQLCKDETFHTFKWSISGFPCWSRPLANTSIGDWTRTDTSY